MLSIPVKVLKAFDAAVEGEPFNVPGWHYEEGPKPVSAKRGYAMAQCKISDNPERWATVRNHEPDVVSLSIA